MYYVQADYCRVRKYIITRYNISDRELNKILMLPEQMSDLTGVNGHNTAMYRESDVFVRDVRKCGTIYVPGQGKVAEEQG